MSDDRDTEWAVYVQRLDPDRREAYVEVHDDVPEASPTRWLVVG